MARRVAMVGQCGIDGPMLASEMEAVLGSVEVVNCNDPGALKTVCDQGVDLLLFNRELSFGFADRSGIETIRKLKAERPDLRVMLVSDYPEAQAAAVEAGALPGFGKADVGSPKVGEALGRALNPGTGQA